MAYTFNAKQYSFTSGLERQTMAEDMFDIYADTDNLDKILAANVASSAARKLEREQQEELWKKENYNARITNETALQQVDIGSTGEGNDAVRNLLRGMQEKVYKAKELGRQNPDQQHKVPQVIAEQEAAIQRIMGVATNVSVSLDAYEKAMKIPPGQAGAVSVMTPNATQNVMLGVKDGSTSFVMKNGELYGIKPNESGGSDVVNLDKLSQEIEGGGNFYQTVPDLTESLKGGYDNVLKPGGKDNADFVTFEEKRVGSQMATVKFMSQKQRDNAADALVKSGQFKGILDDDERMKVIWSDMMGNDVPWQQVEGDTPEEVKANLEEQRNKAAYFLAQKAIEDNAPADGVKMITSTSKYKPPTGPKGPKPETDLQQAKRMRYTGGSQDARALAGNNVEPQEIADYLNDINDGDYSVVDKDEVIASLNDEQFEAYEELEDEKAKDKYLEGIMKKNGIKIGDIVDGDGKVIKTDEDSLRGRISDEGGYSKDEAIVYNSKASAAAKKAYEELDEDKRPKDSDKYFAGKDGKKRLNPAYKGKNSGNKSKSFIGKKPGDVLRNSGTIDDPDIGIPKVADAQDGRYYKNSNTGTVYLFKDGKYTEV